MVIFNFLAITIAFGWRSAYIRGYIDIGLAYSVIMVFLGIAIVIGVNAYLLKKLGVDKI